MDRCQSSGWLNNRIANMVVFRSQAINATNPQIFPSFPLAYPSLWILRAQQFISEPWQGRYEHEGLGALKRQGMNRRGKGFEPYEVNEEAYLPLNRIGTYNSVVEQSSRCIALRIMENQGLGLV
ncbi:hypothetical protein I7I53_08506 [Histoplasma capsulatum var. duboisii H88]|uniref:Uncharacterized protein n=1 Tax=Ajellomyces capsulatus (strain H88) TaxID=544711 RepID=A0A8A1LJG1_AJEC8|nr:hypothetical protein I7I53_08506 [Histoplasma capsulatum var. duboisii H88]